MPAGWSWLFGHNLVILRYMKRLPRLANVVLAMKEPSQEFTDTERFLLDLWPAYPSSIVVFNPDACTVVSQKWNLPRPPQSEVAIRPIVGGPSLVSMSGSQWKTWRSLLNPGFSDWNIMHHVPFIVDCVGVFCERLKNCVGKDMIFLDDLASRLTFDVIMKVTQDADVDHRTKYVAPETKYIGMRNMARLCQCVLVGPEYGLYPPQNGYRPWDTGSRTCIGKSLALTELKVILVMCARSFTIEPAYEEWDRLQEAKCGLWGKSCNCLFGEDIKTVNGDRAYQSEKAGTHPADGYPCRVSLAEEAST